MASMKRWIKRTAAVLLSSVLLAGCERIPDITAAEITEETTDSFAGQLVGIYKTDSEEDGEIILQIYQIQDRLIAEVEEEYAAYYAMEWMPEDSQKTDSDTESRNYTSYTFSGFSNFGKYWDAGRKVTVSLTDTGVELTDENGERTLYTRDEDAEPIHDSGKYDWFFQETGGEIVPLALTGGWTGASEDGYVMFLELAADGNMIWFCKKEGEPVFFHIGVAEVDPETGTITTISERVGCADMPGLYDIEYTFAADGTLLLKNPELGGILPGDEAIAFTKTTGKEGGV